MEFLESIHPQLHFYIFAFLAATLSGFLRGFQNKNVMASMKRLTFGTGWLMGIADSIAIGMIVKAGLIVGIFSGLGLGTGYVLSIIIHKRVMRNKVRAQKLRKKSKLDLRIEKAVREALEERDNG